MIFTALLNLTLFLVDSSFWAKVFDSLLSNDSGDKYSEKKLYSEKKVG